MVDIKAQEKLTLRRPVKEDASAILECHRQAILSKALDYYGHKIVQSWSPEITPERIQNVEAEIAQQEWIYLVAENTEGIIGFGIVVPENFELRAVYVRSNRSGSVGTIILKELLSQAKLKNLSYLELDASSNSAEFYERNGFRVLAQGIHVLSTGDEMACVKMRIDL
jgi:Acetyltransferase (GNAT) domain